VQNGAILRTSEKFSDSLTVYSCLVFYDVRWEYREGGGGQAFFPFLVPLPGFN